MYISKKGSYLLRSFLFACCVLILPVYGRLPGAHSLECSETSGRIIIKSLLADELPAPLDYRVYLPPCYDEDPSQRYPVLYLIHGQSYSDDQWDRMGVDEAATGLILAGEIPPLIIVMPRDRRWSQPETDPFGEAVADDLIPVIDREYRTLADRQHRSIGGLSRGGGWAVHLGLSRWDLFGALGGHSLAVFWSDTSKIRAWLAEIPSAERPNILLDIGDRDRPAIFASSTGFEKILTQMGIPHEWHLFVGYHEEPYWEKHLEQYLRWYTQDW